MKQILIVIVASRRLAREVKIKKSQIGKFPARAFSSFYGFHRKPIIDAGLSHLDHALAAIVAREQADQRLRRVFEAVDHVLLHLELA